MEGIISVVALCSWLGIIILCIVLIVSGILRWLAPYKTRVKRLNIIAWIAFAVLCIIFLARYMIADPQGNEIITETAASILFNTVKGIIELLMFGTIAASVVVMILVIILCIYKSFRVVIQIKTSAGDIDKNLEKASKESFTLVKAIKTPIVILVITWGILALFFILPFLVGEQANEGPIETWKDGVCKVESLFGLDAKENRDGTLVSILATRITANGEVLENQKNKNQKNNEPKHFSSETLATYVLIYIIALGVGFAVIKILYSIIERTLEKKQDRNLIDEYSSPIALLSVGVALLWTFRNGDFPKESFYETICALLESFVTVVFIVALVILTLEIIRLLMDMREKLIRRESRYLFISLVGQAAMLILGMLNSICDALNSAIGSTEDTNMKHIEAKLEQKMVQTMDEEIDNRDNYKITFSPFEEKVTKK